MVRSWLWSFLFYMFKDQGCVLTTELANSQPLELLLPALFVLNKEIPPVRVGGAANDFLWLGAPAYFSYSLAKLMCCTQSSCLRRQPEGLLDLCIYVGGVPKWVSSIKIYR